MAVKNTMIMKAHAQSQTTANTTNTTNTTAATNFLTYKDSKGRFTINYPSGWRVMDLITVINGNQYWLVYNPSPDSFDTYLPTIDKMISSFRIPANATTTTH
jgi:hypothetical protein